MAIMWDNSRLRVQRRNTLKGAAGDHSGANAAGARGSGVCGRSRTIGRAHLRANSPTSAAPEHGQPIGRDLGYSTIENSKNWACFSPGSPHSVVEGGTAPKGGAVTATL
eukprot:6078756-Prymnesium_polylepis.1